MESFERSASRLAIEGPSPEAVVRLRLDSIGLRADIAVLRAENEMTESLLDLYA
jgi:hypothetical protein